MHPQPLPTKAAALAALKADPLGVYTWMDGTALMSAIYWNGRRRIQKADAPVNTRRR
jgi:hypothetical protein